MRRKRPLEYWLQKLRDTGNTHIVISDLAHWHKNKLYEVSIGDADTYDSWQKQPFAWAEHKQLNRAIEIALERYEQAQRQMLLDQLK